jgi:hypothetical protein
MSKKTLKAQTTVGEFTRATASNYTHVVVWDAPYVMNLFVAVQNGDAEAICISRDGVQARWVKDRGYGVTWHSSAAAANKAARGRYGWVINSTLVGVFEVAA